MAADIYLRGRIYWCRVRDRRGQIVRRSTHCRDRTAALLARRELERQAANPAYYAAHKATLADGIEWFLRFKREAGSAEGTLDMYDTKTAHIARVLDERTRLIDIDAARVNEFTARRKAEGASQHTIKKELVALRGMLKVAKREHNAYPLDLGAVMPINFSAGYVPRKRALTWVELSKLLKRLPPKRAAHVALVVGLGPRRSESYKIRRSDVDLHSGFAKIPGTKTKGSDRYIPIPSIFRHLVEQALRDGTGGEFVVEQWTNSRRDLALACQEGGIEPVTLNDLRRTHGSLLRQQGVPNADIAKMLGHVDSKMVDLVYGQMPPVSLQAALDRHLGRGTKSARHKQRMGISPEKRARKAGPSNPVVGRSNRSGRAKKSAGFALRPKRWRAERLVSRIDVARALLSVGIARRASPGGRWHQWHLAPAEKDPTQRLDGW